MKSSPKKISILALLIIGLGWGALRFYQSERPSPIDYSTQVKPILNKKCIACHGGVKREAGFSLLFRQEALAIAESGKHPIIPGDIKNSELVKRIHSTDPEERMPYKKEPLTENEIKILTQWIKEGAPWGDHWAYVKIQPPAVPATAGESNIDKFIAHKQQAYQLGLSDEADKNTLLRRVSLDLLGLPAEEKMSTAFLQNKSDQAYEELVDGLLQSPHYGERWASVWMDVARYGDTKGYERDDNRNIWRYRDWLIKAFNEDKPYNQFVTEQLAGDLLPNPTDQQYIATAFHRNTLTNDEGGTDNEEFRTSAVLDRVNTTWEGLMGTTFACVQCHSHPYDPFRHEEYYKFVAFFNNTRDEDTYAEYPTLRHFDQVDSTSLMALKSWVEKNISKEKSKNLAAERQLYPGGSIYQQRAFRYKVVDFSKPCAMSLALDRPRRQEQAHLPVHELGRWWYLDYPLGQCFGQTAEVGSHKKHERQLANCVV
jgi:hypothetical protein